MERSYAPTVTVKSGNRFFQISFERSNINGYYDSSTQIRIREGNWDYEPGSKDPTFTYNRRRFKSLVTIVNRIRKDFNLTEPDANTVMEAIRYSLSTQLKGGGRWKKFVVPKIN